jgi:F-type H+-transporting ATPase subunit delta
MSANLIASRYAKSLIDLAQEQNKLDQVYGDITGLKEAVENKDLFLLLKSPIINAAKKNSILKTIFDGKIDSLSTAFIDIVVRKGREKILPEIMNEFIKQYKTINKITSVKLISATALEAAVLDNITKELSSSDSTDEKIELDVEVDPSLVGGFVLQIEDKLYDASVAHQLSKLRKSFSSTSNN